MLNTNRGMIPALQAGELGENAMSTAMKRARVNHQDTNEEEQVKMGEVRAEMDAKYGKRPATDSAMQRNREAAKQAALNFAENLVTDVTVLKQLPVKVDGKDTPYNQCLNGQVRVWAQLEVPIARSDHVEKWRPDLSPWPKLISMKKDKKLEALTSLVNIYTAVFGKTSD